MILKQPTIINTRDKSHTLYVEELDETYHSDNGAITESRHIFIDYGLKYMAQHKTNFTVFEIGFGTGLNAILSLEFLLNQNFKVDYQVIDNFVVDFEIIEKMNYKSFLDPSIHLYFDQLHHLNWDQANQVIPSMNLTKIKKDFLTFNLKNESIDLFYFDAFAPLRQPQMWTQEVLTKVFNSLKKDGFLVTYCAKSSIKKLMKDIGYRIEVLPGPYGRREMTRAFRN